MLAEAAPLLLNPELDLVAISLVTLVGGLLLLAFLHSAKAILEPIISAISGKGGNIFDRVLNWAIGIVTAPVKFAVKHILHYVSVALAGVERQIGSWFHAIANLITASSTEVADLAATVAESLWELTWRTVPKMIAAEVAPVRTIATKAWNWTRDLERVAKGLGFASLATLLRWAHPLIRRIEVAERWAERVGYSSLAGALGVLHTGVKRWEAFEQAVIHTGFYSAVTAWSWIHHAVAVTIPAELGALGHDLSGLKDRLAKLEKYLNPAAFAALVAAAITTLGLDWIKCENNKTLGKNVCSWDKELLEALLAGAITSLALTDVKGLIEAGYEAGVAAEGFIQDTLGLG